MSDRPPNSPASSSRGYHLPSESSRVVTVAGLVFALVSLLAVPVFVLLGFLINAFFPHQGSGLGYLGLVVGIVSSMVGVILSALGLRSPSRRGLAIVGLTLSIVVFVILLGLVLLILSPVRGDGPPPPSPTVLPG